MRVCVCMCVEISKIHSSPYIYIYIYDLYLKYFHLLQGFLFKVR